MRHSTVHLFADAERKGYGVVDISLTQLKTKLRVVKDVAQQDAGIKKLAQFSVTSGRAVVEQI